MLIDRALDEMTKKNRVVVGFDLENDFSQISYCRQNQSIPDTVSLVMGEEQYNIPTLLCRRNDVEGEAAWLIGNEALKAAKEGQGVLVEDLLLLAKNNVSVRVGGTDSLAEEEVSAEYLLEIFVKKAIAILSAYIVSDDIAAVAFTMKDINTDVMKMLRNIAKQIGKRKTDRKSVV